MYCYNKKRERTHHQWTAHPSADFHYGFWLLALILSSVTVCFTLWPDPQLESSGTGGTRLDGDFKGEMSWQFCVPNNAHPPDANLPSGHVVGAVTWDIEGHVRWALAGVEVPGGAPGGLDLFPWPVHLAILQWRHTFKMLSHPGVSGQWCERSVFGAWLWWLSVYGCWLPLARWSV